MWEALPVPPEAMLTLPGLALAQATNSGTVLAGLSTFTSITSGKRADHRDRHDVADEIEAEVLVERGVGRHRLRDQQQRVAVRLRARDRLDAEIGAGARPVLDDEGLAHVVRQPLRRSDAR